jgi:hypothetical protein
MAFRRGIIGIMTLCFTASSVLADEVLYCTDTAATGYLWDQGKAASVTRTVFTEQRFTIKVVSASGRIITSMIGDTAGHDTTTEKTKSTEPPLPFINIAAWRDQPVPERVWTVKDRIPGNNVTLLSGEGSIGKSTSLLFFSPVNPGSRIILTPAVTG